MNTASRRGGTGKWVAARAESAIDILLPEASVPASRFRRKDVFHDAIQYLACRRLLGFAKTPAQPDHDIARQTLMRNIAKTLSDHALDAVPANRGRNDALADGDAQPSVAGLAFVPIDGEPVYGVRPLLQYPRKSVPTRQAIAPGKSLGSFRVTRQDVRGRVRDGQR